MENTKMQELASKYVRREITMTEYCDGMDKIMVGDMNRLESTDKIMVGDMKGSESTVSKVSGCYQKKRDDKGGPI